MAHDIQNPNAQLRNYLHGELADFVESVEVKARAQGDTALLVDVRRQHQQELDALLNGDEVRGIARYRLPDWHPESTVYGGDPGDRFTLGRDDILRPDPFTPKFVPPYTNRAQRRAMNRRRKNGHGS